MATTSTAGAVLDHPWVNRAERYEATGGVDIVRQNERIGYGRLKNISRSGVAFTCDVPLPIGERFSLKIEQLGNVQATIVRCSDGQFYGAKFEFTHESARRVGDAIEVAFGNKKGTAAIKLMSRAKL